MAGFKKILLVEDDPISLMIVTRLMEISNFSIQVETAENGLIACNMLQKCKDENLLLPEIILLDLRMGIMDGWEFLDWYNEFSKDMAAIPPVYILSSTIDDSDTNLASTYKQVKGFISKPITTEHLKEIMEENQV